MSNIQFECTLTTPGTEPLYKQYYGLMTTFIELSMDIMANAKLLRLVDIHIVDYKVPTLDELLHSWNTNEELVYTISCRDTQFYIEFRLSPKHIEQ